MYQRYSNTYLANFFDIKSSRSTKQENNNINTNANDDSEYDIYEDLECAKKYSPDKEKII